jgi:hypothetical protein
VKTKSKIRQTTMADVELPVTDGIVTDAAKALESGDSVPKVLDSPATGQEESKAPPSTPTKDEAADANADEEQVAVSAKARKKPESFLHFPRFRVTWDSSIPSLMSLKSPGKKKRRNSQTAMAERPSVHMAQEMSPQSTLVEFIVTSASYHGVRRQNLTALEDELFRVFRNNVMPANAAAWYMASRRFYNPQNQLLPTLLKEFPKKFAIKNNVVQFLESYSPTVARMKMKYLVEQGLYAYFSHKADEYGVYFFDPLYYEETEPFHANLRLVTNIYNNQKIKLVPAFFKKFKKQFHYKQLSPYLVAISKVESEILHGVTGVIVGVVDKKYGLIRFNRSAESCLALFSLGALFKNGFKFSGDPKTLPPVFFDAYKIPESDKVDKFKWFAVLTWIGRKPNPRFCSTQDELNSCQLYKQCLMNNNDPPIVQGGKKEDVDYMKMGIVKEIRKNGAVALVKEEGQDLEQKFFIPGWSFTHINTPKIVKFLTTTQGVGLSVGDLVNFYIDHNMHAKPYDAVACNVDVLKHAEVAVKKRKKSVSGSGASPKKQPPMSWKNFLMTAEIVQDDDEDAEAGLADDPDWLPPENYQDSDEMDSDISDEEIRDLAESLKQDLKIEEILPATATTTTTTEPPTDAPAANNEEAATPNDN